MLSGGRPVRRTVVDVLGAVGAELVVVRVVVELVKGGCVVVVLEDGWAVVEDVDADVVLLIAELLVPVVVEDEVVVLVSLLVVDVDVLVVVVEVVVLLVVDVAAPQDMFSVQVGLPPYAPPAALT